jgi:alpha/beta hydrolase family protein DUF900
LIPLLQLPSSQSLYVSAQTSDTSKASTSSSYNHNNTISTRGHFNYLAIGELTPKNNSTDYLYYNEVGENKSRTQNEIMCPSQKEIAIYVHGAWTNKASANEQFNRTAISLATNNYAIPLIGFSWDSNTPFNEDGWKTAKTIAEKNGHKLARFIMDFKNECQDTEIRIIAHSLGAAVVNSTLISLSNSHEWNTTNNDFNITSVHLLGAAIDRNAIASNTTFGKAIEKVVGNFYNLRNPEDNMLEYAYKYVENDDALGLLGIQHSLPLPRDYIERQVDSEIPPIDDADGNNRLDCFDYFVILPGDNHCGYIGFRGLPPFVNILRDDGSMDVVVEDWLE